jgi:predicted DsbA family dithiol-disulfide isomerase
MRFWILPIFLLSGLGLAQISYPIADFNQRLGMAADAGPTYEFQGAQIKVELLPGRLYRLEYQGPAENLAQAGQVVAAGMGVPELAASFSGFLLENTEQLAGEKMAVEVGIGDGYVLMLQMVDGDVRYTLSPEMAENLPEPKRPQGQSGVVIREFSEFECPFCKQMFLQALPKVRSELIQTDKAQISFYHFPLYSIHPSAVSAAEASACAEEQDKFWEYHDALFTLGLNNYWAVAEDVDLDTAAFAQCFAERRYKAEVENEQAQARALGINATPTVYVGPFKLPNPHDPETYLRYVEMAAELE